MITFEGRYSLILRISHRHRTKGYGTIWEKSVSGNFAYVSLVDDASTSTKVVEDCKVCQINLKSSILIRSGISLHQSYNNDKELILPEQKKHTYSFSVWDWNAQFQLKMCFIIHWWVCINVTQLPATGVTALKTLIWNTWQAFSEEIWKWKEPEEWWICSLKRNALRSIAWACRNSLAYDICAAELSKGRQPCLGGCDSIAPKAMCIPLWTVDRMVKSPAALLKRLKLHLRVVSLALLQAIIMLL